MNNSEEIKFIGQYKMIFESGRIFGDNGSDTWHSNYNRAIKKNLDACEACGRGVAEAKGFMVYVVEGGAALAVDQWEAWEDDQTVDHSGDMGCWVIGPECGKKLPSEFRKAR